MRYVFGGLFWIFIILFLSGQGLAIAETFAKDDLLGLIKHGLHLVISSGAALYILLYRIEISVNLH